MIKIDKIKEIINDLETYNIEYLQSDYISGIIKRLKDLNKSIISELVIIKIEEKNKTLEFYNGFISQENMEIADEYIENINKEIIKLMQDYNNIKK